MATNRNAVKAGFFMLFSIAAAIAIIIGIVGFSKFKPQQTRLVAFTLSDNIGGLRQGDDVRLGGFKVGSVSDIRYLKKDDLGPNLPPADGIVVWMTFPAEYVLATDAKVGVEASLTGATWINISDLGHLLAMDPNGMLVGRPDALTAFKTELGEIGPKLNGDLDDVHNTLDTYKSVGTKAGADVHDLSIDLHARLKQVSDSAQAALDSIHEWLGPSTTDFHQSVANLRHITDNLNDKVPGITASTQKLLDQLNASVAKAQGAIDDVKTTAANAKDLTAQARSIIIRNSGAIDEIVAGLKRASDNIDNATVEIRASPWRLLYKPTPDEMANLNLYDAARQFAQGANNVNDAAVALRDALKDGQADPAKVQKLYDNLIDQFNQFHIAEDGLWKKVQE
jgi:ABC-type transporter Mla subunit MlaD